MPQESPLKILVVGAGIGGLTAAVALRQQGHNVEIYEKSALANEMGAAIGLQPNSTTLLRRFGLEPEEFGAVTMENMFVRDFRTLEANEAISRQIKEVTVHREQKTYFILRADLHNVLKRKATDKEGSGPPAVLHTASSVESVDFTAPSITFSDGTIVTGDVVIAADGVHSRVRREIHGEEQFREFPSTASCFRFLIPIALLRDDPETRLFVDAPGALTDIVGPDRRIIFYPCASGDLMNILAILPRDEVDRDSGRSLKAKVLGAYPEFGPAVHRMLEKTEEHRITVYDIFDMEALPGWTKGSVALLGDAAHPFTPFLAQGALQAIEDAASLAVMLPRGISREEVPSRLKLYEQCRKPRAEQIQEFSRIRGRDASGKHGPPPTGADLQRFAIYCVAHDEWVNSTKFLAEKTGQ